MTHEHCHTGHPSMNDADEWIRAHGVRPTAVRLLVWEEALRHHSVFSLLDMERAMPQMDRSSIFRTLRLFADSNLLHTIDDGSGFQKYCVCRCPDEQHRGHVHFTCLRCGTTFCLESTTIPRVSLPAGFEAQEEEYVIKGICPQCAKR